MTELCTSQPLLFLLHFCSCDRLTGSKVCIAILKKENFPWACAGKKKEEKKCL